MLSVGLTGGVGGGKSAITAMFAQRGAGVVANYARISRAVIDGDRDAIARQAVRIG